MTGYDGTRGRALTTAGLVLLSTLAFALRWQTRDEPLERDLTTYAVIAHEMLEGRALYADLWDHKPPLVHVLFAGAELAAGYGPRAIFALNVLGTFGALFGLFAAVRAASGSAALGLWAAATWTIVSGDPGVQGNQPNTELFMSALAAWAAYVAVKLDERPSARGALVLGGLGLAASMLKPVFLIALAPLLVAAVLRLWARGHSGAAGFLAAAVPAGWAATSLWFAAHSSWAAFSDAVFAYNRFYAGSPRENLVKALAPERLAPPYARFLLPLAAMALLGAALGLRGARRRTWGVVLASWLGTWLAILLPGPFHAHYYQLWLVPLIGGAALALFEVAGSWRRTAAAATAGALLVFLVAKEAPAWARSPEEWSRRKYGIEFVDTREQGMRFGRLLLPGEKLLLWGAESGLYFYSGRSPATGFVYVYPLLQGPNVAARLARFCGEAGRSEAEAVVVSRRALPTVPCLREVLGAAYAPAPDLVAGEMMAEVWVKKGGAFEQRLGRGAR